MANNKIKGYFCGAVSGASYGLIPLFSLPVMRQGVDYDSLLFYRYAVAAVVLALIMRLRGRSLMLKRNEMPFVGGLGLLFALSSILMFMAFDYMPTGLVSTMFFIYPILVAVIMALIYRERMSAGRALSLLMAVGGIGLLYASNGGERLSLAGVALTFGAALSYALYIIITNKSRMRHVDSSKVAFWSLAVGGMLFFCRTGCGVNLQAVPSTEAWGLVLLLAIVPTVVSCTSLVVSVRCIGSTATSILGALEPVTAVVCGTLVFAEPMSVRIFCGIATIIAAVVVLMTGDHAKHDVCEAAQPAGALEKE